MKPILEIVGATVLFMICAYMAANTFLNLIQLAVKKAVVEAVIDITKILFERTELAIKEAEEEQKGHINELAKIFNKKHHCTIHNSYNEECKYCAEINL